MAKKQPLKPVPMIVQVSNDLGKAKMEWQKAKLARDEAEAAFEYAQKRMTLHRDRLELELNSLPDEDAFHWELEGWLADFFAVRYVGKTIGEAVRLFLSLRGNATTDAIVQRLTSGGFTFTADAPAREVHAALVKQPWAAKDPKTKEWVYRK